MTLTVLVEDDVLRTRIGPFDGERLRAELAAEGGERIDLRRLLDTVVDRAEIDGNYIELRKSLH